ncbi:uncharacterized protein [Dendrobates tinctorius]|uniref:uncharacterized protein n=1 Tax=Dendrobates tinctorius TaxID=92724 RepID=UPI003CCA2A6A
MEDHTPPTSPDGSINSSTPERYQRPYSDHWPGEEEDDVPQIDDLVIIKVEDPEGDEGYVRTEGHHMEDSTDISQAKAMIRKHLTTQQRDLIVESYQSGDGYKKISKALDISRNTVRTVIKKWLKFGTTVTLPRTGRPSKIDVRTRRKLVREAAKRPRATLKELQEFLASTGCVLHVTTISRILHMSNTSVLCGMVAKQRKTSKV